jgi:hypothetical protein
MNFADGGMLLVLLRRESGPYGLYPIFSVCSVVLRAVTNHRTHQKHGIKGNTTGYFE